MIRRFTIVFVWTLLAALTAYAQQTPAAEQPPGQPSTQQAPDQPATTQEPPEEQTGRRRKVRPHDYLNWTFNVGGGADLPSGTTRTYVKGGGAVGTAGVARNFSRYFGLRADFLYANLPLRSSALELAQAPGSHSQVYGITIGPIINIPVTKLYSGYLLFGPGFYHRSGKLDSTTVVPGSSCTGFFQWWGSCVNGIIPLNKGVLNSSQTEFGFNFGGGVARKIRGNLEVYGEFRYEHAKHNGITTDVRPITIGVRW
jgi:opacity protein-like surface antigen